MKKLIGIASVLLVASILSSCYCATQPTCPTPCMKGQHMAG